MVNKQAKERLYSVVLALLLLAVMLVGGRCISFAFANTPQFTSALMDLQKDGAFNAADYPNNAKDYSIQVIQIAESTDKELFVYTYQPSQATTYIVATEINMSLSESVDGTQPYGLTLLSSDGVFCKYRVNDITVSDEAKRYYNITSIYREFIKGVDEKPDNGNTVNNVAFDVGKCYIAQTENDKITYSYEKKQTIEIIDPFAGFIEYFNGYKFCSWSHCHSHFVAFSTDLQIDILREADVDFYTQKFYKHYSMTSGVWTSKDNPVNQKLTVKGSEKASNEADGFLGKVYEWERIQSVAEFIRTEDIKSDMIKHLDGKQWVLRFYETPYVEKSTGVSSSDSWTELSNVTVLRLKFVTNGKLYNLGAVSDKVTGSDTPINNNTDEMASLLEWLSRVTGIPEEVWVLIFVAIALAILLPILSLIFPVVGQVLSICLKVLLKAVVWLFKGLWWLICLPFKGIAALVGKIRERKGDNVE